MEDRPSEPPSNVTVRSFVLQLDLFEVKLEPDGVRARPTGWLRFLPGIVATTWLTVWAFGESFAWRVFADLRREMPSPPEPLLPALTRDPAAWIALLPAAFLALWIAGWTAAGGLALWMAARWMVGFDLARVVAGGLEVTRGVGPISSRRTYPRDRVSSLPLRRRGRGLQAIVDSHPRTIVSFGTPQQLTGARDHLSGLLGLPAVDLANLPASLPTDWTSRSDLDGTTLLEQRSPGRLVGAGVRWSLAALCGFGLRYVLAHRTDWGEASIVAAAALAVGGLVFGWSAAATTFASARYRVAHGRLIHERRFAGWAGSEEFVPPAFAVQYKTDSDGDERCSLTVRAGERKRAIASAINDSEEIVQLARWLERETGGELSLPHELRAA